MDIDREQRLAERELVTEAWYLLRTKAGEERRARDQVSRLATDVLLPLIKVHVRRWGRMVDSVAALFPGYLFALFDLDQKYGRLRYTRGVREIVRFGGNAAIVPDWIVGELKQHCAGGALQLPSRRLVAGERVMVIDGPFREFEGIFERHLSGPERVAILLSVMGAGVRAVLPARMVVPTARDIIVRSNFTSRSENSAPSPPAQGGYCEKCGNPQKVEGAYNNLHKAASTSAG